MPDCLIHSTVFQEGTFPHISILRNFNWPLKESVFPTSSMAKIYLFNIYIANSRAYLEVMHSHFNTQEGNVYAHNININNNPGNLKIIRQFFNFLRAILWKAHHILKVHVRVRAASILKSQFFKRWKSDKNLYADSDTATLQWTLHTRPALEAKIRLLLVFTFEH